MSSEDGPGLRTTAFLKGCPLSCIWCHNPESISLKGEVLWHAARCIKCESCVEECPRHGIELGESRLTLERETCPACFTCVNACPTGALEAKGTPIEIDELVHELLKDRAYFGEDGGITISGGEALFQPESIDLLKALRETGAQVAVDTCGQVSTQRFQEALELTDIMLFDLKSADDEEHRQLTGAGNGQIRENLVLAADWAADGRLWIRTPVIPGITDSDENIRGIAEILQGLPQGPSAIERWELCAFNNLCASKYTSLERTWELEHTPLMTKERMQELVGLAKAQVDIEDIRATGSTI